MTLKSPDDTTNDLLLPAIIGLGLLLLCATFVLSTGDDDNEESEPDLLLFFVPPLVEVAEYEFRAGCLCLNMIEDQVSQ